MEKKDSNFRELKTKNIRNFSIIAHVDHGKSTLANLILRKMIPGYQTRFSSESAFHRLSLEEQKGITIKLNPIQFSSFSPFFGETIIFNMIDTPGHVDFKFEVTLSLAVCEGVILLVDASQGVQSQTVFYYRIAKKLSLKIIPVITKIDLPNIQLESVKRQIQKLTGCEAGDILLISAKSDCNIDSLIEKIAILIPPPKTTVR